MTDLSYKHPRGLTSSKSDQLCDPHPLSTKMNRKLFKNNRICKHEKNYKTPSPPTFYVDVINVWSLYYGKCITQMKDGPSVIKFLKSVSS